MYLTVLHAHRPQALEGIAPLPLADIDLAYQRYAFYAEHTFPDFMMLINSLETAMLEQHKRNKKATE